MSELPEFLGRKFRYEPLSRNSAGNPIVLGDFLELMGSFTAPAPE